MKNKLLLSLAAVITVIGGVAAMSAFEAHIVNVTAHIENALAVSPKEILFGTVFPQEFLEKPFRISLSDSFKGADRVDDVEYIIKQKIKPCPLKPGVTPPAPIDPTCVADDPQNIPEIPEIPENRTGFHYLNLCPFLSKLNIEQDEDEGATENDIDEQSYFDPATNRCPPRPAVMPGGKMTKAGQDTEDGWLVDLKVPPVKGNVGQDWPAGCPTVQANDITYGCDLWIEVTGISEAGAPPAPSPTPATGYLVINEVYYDQPSTDMAEFIELWGPANFPLDGYKILLINGNTGTIYKTINLANSHYTDSNGFFLIATNPVYYPIADLIVLPSENLIQNGPDSVQLAKTVGDADVSVDLLGYCTGDCLSTIYEGSPAPDVDDGHSLSRGPSHADTDNNLADFIDLALPTPKTP